MATATKPTRRDVSVQRRNQFWAQRIAAAETPVEKAAVEWNLLRAEIHKLPRGAAQSEAWQSIRYALKLAFDEIRDRQQTVAEANPCPSSRPAPPTPLAVRAAGFVYDVIAGRR